METTNKITKVSKNKTSTRTINRPPSVIVKDSYGIFDYTPSVMTGKFNELECEPETPSLYISRTEMVDYPHDDIIYIELEDTTFEAIEPEYIIPDRECQDYPDANITYTIIENITYEKNLSDFLFRSILSSFRSSPLG